ncbi:DUF4238 domain-containing protein [Spirillospora sp. CA-128828]|uniref:DUF4238 domain-containing protein n=1 Tax=Spirillospora sp. CA-128828 TaxID=3240033 RepID=UPI003D8FF4E8
MPERARRHHVVSRFYLRYFADELDRVTTVMLPGERTFTQNIANASVQTDFYTVIDNDGHESDLAEQALSQIETLAADAWRELAAGVWPLPEEHREAMAAWLALQLLRGSGVRNSMSEIATHALLLETIIGGRRRVREALQAAGEPADDETVDREWVGFFKNPLRAQVHANHHVQHLAQLLPRVTQSLLDRSWLLTVFQRKTLATSDHPVFVVPNDDATGMGMGTGVENATVLHAPLTRRHSLAMYPPSAVPPEISAHERDVRVAGVAAVALFSNSCVVNSARRFLFHHPKDTPLAGFDLPQPREREVAVTAQLWGWIPEDDRQVLLDAEFGPDDLNALIEHML